MPTTKTSDAVGLSDRERKALKFPDLLTPEQRVDYQTEIWNVPTTVGTLAVKRSQNRDIRYTKLNGRIYYRKKDVDWYFENARYIETLESHGGLERN